MNIKRAILACAQAASGRASRTVIQKLMYLSTLKGLTKASFEPHYYGPYSTEVAATLQDLASTGLVDESIQTWPSIGDPWEIRRYSYAVPTEVAKALEKGLLDEERNQAESMARLVEACEKRGALNPKSLSVATKILFILHETGRPLTESQIAANAESLGWKLSKEVIEKSVVGLLSDLSLVERT